MGRPLMATFNLPFVNAFIDRHGHERHYFRKRGCPRVALPGQPGSREFMAAYADCMGDAPKAEKKRAGVKDGTFEALALAYFKSPLFKNLSASSKINYRRVIEAFIREHGHRRIDQFKRAHVDEIIGRMSDRPGAGIILLKRIGLMLRYAIKLGWVDRDPTAGATSYTSEEFHTWTEDEIATFEARWPVGTKQRLAFDLLLYTGQRGSDVCRMSQPDSNAKIRVVQRKTKARLAVTLHPGLRDSIEACPSGHVAVLTTAYGSPFSVKGFGQFVSAAIRKAGLPDECKAHGLRKAAARRLAEAGCTAHEIMSVTGHKTLAEVERYTRAAGQERLNEIAVAKQVGNASVTTPPAKGDNPIESKG